MEHSESAYHVIRCRCWEELPTHDICFSHCHTVGPLGCLTYLESIGAKKLSQEFLHFVRRSIHSRHGSRSFFSKTEKIRRQDICEFGEK